MNQFDPFGIGAQFDHSDDMKKDQLSKDSNFVGVLALSSVLIMPIIVNVISVFLHAIGVLDLNTSRMQYMDMGYWQYLIYSTLEYILILGLSAPIIAAIGKRKINPFSRFFDKPNNQKVKPTSVILAIIVGLSVCVLANLVSSVAFNFFAIFGYEMPKTPEMLQATPQSLIANLFTVAIIPAIVEEVLFRGYIMRALLPHGRGFSVIVSSLIFAFFHTEPVHIIFTFFVGLACATLALRTNSILPPIILHFLNNALSTVLNYVGRFVDSPTGYKITLITYLLAIAIGSIALIILIAKKDPIIKKETLLPGETAKDIPHGVPLMLANASDLPTGQKVTTMLASPVFLITAVLLILQVIFIVIA